MVATRFAVPLALGLLGVARDYVRGRRRPFVVNHLVTVRCNLACPYCYVSGPEQKAFNQAHYGRRTEMDTVEMCAFYRQLVAHSFKIAIVLGGEPLMRSDFGEMLRVLHRKLYVTVFTNGYALPERHEAIKTATSLFVSLDAPDEDHDRLRARAGSFRRALEGIEIVRRRYPAIKLAINMTVSAQNVRRVGEMIRLAKSLSLPVAFQPPSFEGQFAVDGRPHTESEGQAATAEELAVAFGEIRAAAERGERIIGSRAFFDLVAEDRKTYPCFYPTYVLGPVLPNGDVVACTQSRVMGNVRDTDLGQILASGPFGENAAAGVRCGVGCRDWGIHDLSAVYGRRMRLVDYRGYYRAFVR